MRRLIPPEYLATIDLCTRIFWCLAHGIGFLFILRCWRQERIRVYGWFAVSWGLMALRSFTVITLNKIAAVHLIGSVLISPAASITGLIAFRLLSKHLARRIAVIRMRPDGDYQVRTFDDEDARDTLRPPPPV